MAIPPPTPPASPPPYTRIPHASGTPAPPSSAASNSVPSPAPLAGHNSKIFAAYGKGQADELKALPGAKFTTTNVDKWKGAIEGRHSGETLNDLTKLLDTYFQEARSQSCKRICLFTEKGAVVLKLKGEGAKAYYEPDMTNNNIKMSMHSAVDNHLTSTILRCLYEDHAISPIVNTSKENSAGESVESKEFDKTTSLSDNDESVFDEDDELMPGPEGIPYPLPPFEPGYPSEPASIVSTDGAESAVLFRSLSEKDEPAVGISTMFIDFTTMSSMPRTNSRTEMERNELLRHEDAANDPNYMHGESPSLPSSLQSPGSYSSLRSPPIFASVEQSELSPKGKTIEDVLEEMGIPKGREEETLLREEQELVQMLNENSINPPACAKEINKLIEDQQYVRSRIITLLISAEAKYSEGAKKFKPPALTQMIEDINKRSIRTMAGIYEEIETIKNAHSSPEVPSESRPDVGARVEGYETLHRKSLPKPLPPRKSQS